MCCASLSISSKLQPMHGCAQQRISCTFRLIFPQEDHTADALVGNPVTSNNSSNSSSSSVQSATMGSNNNNNSSSNSNSGSAIERSPPQLNVETVSGLEHRHLQTQQVACNCIHGCRSYINKCATVVSCIVRRRDLFHQTQHVTTRG